MRIIAIRGYKYSGKDTLADILATKYNYNKISLAEPLKLAVSNEYNVPLQLLNDPKTKDSPLLILPVITKDDFSLYLHKYLLKEFRTATGLMPNNFYITDSKAFTTLIEGSPEPLYWTPRALCILKGNSTRAINSNYWPNITINKILNNPNVNYVIPDLRFKSEIEALKTILKKDLTLVEIKRSINVSNDPSECDLDGYNFDYIIENYGSIEELELKIESLLNGNKN